MNTKGYLLLLLLVVLLAVGAWFAFGGIGGENAEKTVELEATLAEKPVIQLSEGGYATFTPREESQPRTVRSGDGLAVPGLLEVDETTTAVVYFSDGSEARMTHGAVLDIREASYEAESGTAKVSFTLEAGRVWSKIVELATPDSKWEVETATAVATVRGTAFDIEVDGESATIFTASNSVAVSVRDPQMKKVISEEAALVSEGGILVIGEEEVAQARASATVKFEAKVAPILFTADLWVTDNAQADKGLDAEIAQWKRDGKSGEELRMQIRTRAALQLQEAIPLENHRAPLEVVAPVIRDTDSDERRDANGEGDAPKSPAQSPRVPALQTETSVPVRAESASTQPTGTNSQEEGAGVLGLDVVSRATLSDIPEGAEIPMRAVIRLDNGETKDVTSEAKWQVVGPIGSVTAGGVFTAKLDSSVVEFGESSGSVVAIWNEPTSGASFLGKTPIFRVLFVSRGSAGEPI
ncbi:MAG: hypothetical protein COV10_02525 [Candidatus Vogelbacteria bacterium CG10_big_fil_rev_8_21_14_0_10_51_16]|uniref:FecR protein domain-containing protein n=1 Tax=Candidatus Vogelbacteria bacterium CG10_big_fil_rev_8_21_14_0_10_51_16 TaxID=1975045 RepID=A0A2H0RFS6_9BACT|nr:MAG: hypothetical protein COV10_02525 [Candidatus Vogelbacteria bacterium CG10_big_fil_rev_8_21_14_0_10_51_16]